MRCSLLDPTLAHRRRYRGSLLHCGISLLLTDRFRSVEGQRRRSSPRPQCPQLPPIAGIRLIPNNRRLVPKAAVSNRSKTVFLLNDLVGCHLHNQRHCEAERLRRFEIDDEFELGRPHHGKLGRLLTLEDAIDIEGRLAELVVYVHSIREEAARIDILTA